ncbi:transposase zinc-binding domain-containing protein [Paenibacillus tarimensis]|nr:transposase zinc-binding domain-containing protein [Paenibacillus tarimensis]
MVCEGCHEMKCVPLRCKGRFCTMCSCGETEDGGMNRERGLI